MSLHADVTVTLDAFDLDVELGAADGEVTAVLGPNGAGKTTLLRAIAGTVPISDGVVTIDGVVVDEPPHTFVPPERRRLGIVHQDHLLFPHLTALDNVAFGPRCAGATRADARRAALAWLERVGVADHAASRPARLSGGQSQRVALARALATEPDALLLDEPLSALDATTRTEVRRDLRRHLTDVAVPTVLVTHDPVDALALADRVVVVEAGRVIQAGPVRELTRRPRSRYVADLVGTNLVRGTASATTITTATGATLTIAGTYHGDVFATVPPAAVALHRSEPDGSPRNRWRVVVRDVDVWGDRARVRVDGPLDLVAEITLAALAELDLHDGDEMWASVKATEVDAYPA